MRVEDFALGPERRSQGVGTALVNAVRAGPGATSAGRAPRKKAQTTKITSKATEMGQRVNQAKGRGAKSKRVCPCRNESHAQTGRADTGVVIGALPVSALRLPELPTDGRPVSPFNAFHSLFVEKEMLHQPAYIPRQRLLRLPHHHGKKSSAGNDGDAEADQAHPASKDLLQGHQR